jgi:8-oxo-dGTP pyrophosphatase MutT (NUDIX family)
VTKAPPFNPREIPVIGVDLHLPKVAERELEPQALRRRFAVPPVWTPDSLTEPRFTEREPQRAAVLIPLVMREQLMVLLTQRTTHLSSHSGQIAFPGGKVDAEDANDTATALREAQEEIGLHPSHAEVIGSLPIYTTGTAFLVRPVVALVQPHAQFSPSEFEVAELFEVPLAFLMDPANHRHHRVNVAGVQREWLSMPYADAQGERFIWGATAGMLRNLYRLLVASL